MLEIREYVDIRDYSTLNVGGQFRYFCIVDSKEKILEALSQAREKKLPVFILGEGSNVVFPDGVFNVFALKIEIKGFEILNETNEFVDIKVGAGENWDSFVERSVEMNLSGIEALSLIPGTVGATPVQNVGAYGQEVKDTILSVEVFDIEKQIFIILQNEDCNFSYRQSIFKRELKGKYIIVFIVFRLSKFLPVIPNYKGVPDYFNQRNISNPNLKDIRNAIIDIRNTKLPNPKEIPNVGSFFENPIVDRGTASSLKEKYQDVPVFELSVFDNDKVKISAGWLIEKSGLKGSDIGKVSVYEKNALVLVNKNEASSKDIMHAKEEIIEIVKQKFEITLCSEPEFL